MKLNALVIDVSILGHDGWEFLERVCGMLPELGVIVCTGQSTVAQRVRGLRLGADDWINKPCHPEEVMARLEAVVRRRRRAAPSRRRPAHFGSSRSAPISSRPSSAATVSSSPGASSSCCTCSPRRRETCSSARRSTSGSGAMRWRTGIAPSTSSSASFARSSSAARRAGSYIHTHFGIGYRFDPESAVEEASSPRHPRRPRRGPGEPEAAAPPDLRAASAPAPERAERSRRSSPPLYRGYTCQLQASGPRLRGDDLSRSTRDATVGHAGRRDGRLPDLRWPGQLTPGSGADLAGRLRARQLRLLSNRPAIHIAFTTRSQPRNRPETAGAKLLSGDADRRTGAPLPGRSARDQAR